MIEAGTLLIEKSAPRPECFHLAPGPDFNSWATVTRDLGPRELDAVLAANGWTFFYRAGALSASAFGFNAAARSATALKRLIAIATREGSNCLEIDAVTTHSFLGFPYVNVSAHSRHIQKDSPFPAAGGSLGLTAYGHSALYIVAPGGSM
jgi:hypothetical protein